MILKKKIIEIGWKLQKLWKYISYITHTRPHTRTHERMFGLILKWNHWIGSEKLLIFKKKIIEIEAFLGNLQSFITMH